MELAILAYRREDRRRREREARRSLDHRKGGGVFIHSAMTDVHPFSYDATKQRFQSTPLQPASLSSLGKLSCDSTVIGDMYNRRFHVLHERCQLHPLLSLHGRDASDGGLSEGGGGRSAAAGGGGGTAYIFRNEEDHDEDHLNHTANRKRVVCDVDAASRRSGHRQLLLGVLGRDANKDLALQGLFSDVRLKFEKDCIPRPGLFLEGHIVLADGCFKEKDDDFFHVCDLSHPPRYPCSDRLSLDCSSSSSSLYGGDDENMKMSGRDLQDEVNEDRMDGEDFFSFSGDTFISKQQGSSMFGGLLTLSQLEALKTWREVEEEKEEDSQAIQEKEEDMNEKLLRIFGVGEGWKNLASREGHRKEEEKDGDDGDKENHLVGDSRRRTREREEHEGGDQERGGRSREGGGGGNRKGREEEGEGEREGRQERYLERRVDDDMGAGNKREEEEEEEEEQRDPMAWVIISECHFDQTVDLRLLESIFSSCHFVFVPGPEDPCFARESLPRLPLTPPFTSDFQQRLEHLIPACKGKIFFTTSPCRIRHFTSSMIFFRHDVFKALSRDALSTKRGNKQGNNTSSSSPSFSVADMLYNTIVGQAHLCPMTADHRLIKHRDQSLGLFPMPDLVFVCDKSAPPMTKTDPNLPKEFIFANADSPFSVSRSFYIYEMSSHRLTKYCVPTGEGEK
ncbi:dna polymerase epsilon subunit b protein [Cystoisospora suis]|uniref:DNA polymerase II subunit 2 n=1 Tax=Cystoisospora suis TaxID=483139 RepID=A0A2C6KGN1_9APIC|nr:dna polymerase epsilon subunit b protein [Cystoisospora suis]